MYYLFVFTCVIFFYIIFFVLIPVLPELFWRGLGDTIILDVFWHDSPQEFGSDCTYAEHI